MYQSLLERLACRFVILFLLTICAATLSQGTGISGVAAQSIPVFEQYGLISSDSEKAILDNFAIELFNDPDLRGYVILRRGKHSSSFARTRLAEIKKYLIAKRRVPQKRIVLFETRGASDFTVQLYLVPKGKKAPVRI